VTAKVEEKKVVRYETVEERRAAMIAKGWSPVTLAQLEEAMEPKFLRDMREENEREENEKQSEANGHNVWLARNHPGYFASLYGKLIPLDVNTKVEEKTVVRYETVEERRAAMIAKGWSPAALEALEAAMEPKFIQEQKKKEEVRAALRERGIDPDILEAPSDVLAAIGLKFLEYKKPDPVQ
jgi:hypothetical protein